MTLKELKELRNSLVKYMKHYNGAYTLGLARPLYGALIEQIDLIESGYVQDPATIADQQEESKYQQ